MAGKNCQIFKKFLKVKLQVNMWRVKFGEFVENPAYLYLSLFLPDTILPVRSKVNYVLN